jgi:hypothetical protein
LLDANYTLGKPSVKIALSVSNDIAADFEKRNPTALASPLGESLNRETGYARDLHCAQERRTLRDSRIARPFLELDCARHLFALCGPLACGENTPF